MVESKTDVGSVIRGHHVYMLIWSATKGEVFFAFPDSREETKVYDKFSIGIYKDENHRTLVGHIPIEISSLCFQFLNQSPDNRINATITGKREREVGLVVPANVTFVSNDRLCAETLEKELLKRK